MEYRDTVIDEPYTPGDLPVKVCMSAAGYYIGQLEPCGVPFSRLSGYFKTIEDAKQHLKEGWPSRGCVENKSLEEDLTRSGKIVNKGLVQ